MTTTRPAWAYTLLSGSTAADGSFRHPRFTGDGYLSPCRSSDARHPEHDARYDPTHVEPLYGDARRGPGDFWSALRQNRATANSTCGRNGFRHCVSGSSLVFNCTSTFVAFRLLQAVGASAMLVATFATVRDVYANRPEGVVIYGLFSSMLAFVPALGPIAGALIGEFLGWQAIFITLAILAMLALLNAGFRWHETRPLDQVKTRRSVLPIFASPAFWVYTVGFSAGMGTFFVFFSTAPRVLIGQAEYSEIGFSFAFATVALVMIVTTRFAKSFVARWGIAGCVARGMALLVCGAVLLGIGELYGSPSFLTFILPMWVVAVGIVFTVSVTANGALAEFDDIAGSAVAFYFCVQSLIVSIVGTLAVALLNGDTAWPVICYATAMAVLVSLGLVLLRLRGAATEKSPVV